MDKSSAGRKLSVIGSRLSSSSAYWSSILSALQNDETSAVFDLFKQLIGLVLLLLSIRIADACFWS